MHQSGDANSAEVKKSEPCRAVVRIVLASVPQLVFVSFLRMLFLDPVFALVLAMWYLYARERSGATSRKAYGNNRDETCAMGNGDEPVRTP